MKTYKISFVLNVVIFFLLLFAVIAMIVGFQFLGRSEIFLANRIEVFKYFTIDSNVFAGFISLLFAFFEYLLLKGKRSEIPMIIYILKYISTVSVVVTFLVTLLFLLPSFSFNIALLYSNSNFFFHLVIPILCFISFVWFEKNNCINLATSFSCLIPVILYSIFYSYIALSHVSNGVVPLEYDWYGFLKGGVNSVFIVVPIMYLSTYFIGFMTWKLNLKGKK